MLLLQNPLFLHLAVDSLVSVHRLDPQELLLVIKKPYNLL
jgi:hypothetical protein